MCWRACIRTARWVALNHGRNEHIYTNYVGSQLERELRHQEDDDEDNDFVSPDDISPEHMIERQRANQDLEAAFASLDATDQQVIRMLKQGFIPAEIAKSMNVSRAIELSHDKSAGIFPRWASLRHFSVIAAWRNWPIEETGAALFGKP